MTPAELTVYVDRQLDSLFPTGAARASDLQAYVDESLERLELCFSSLRLKYFQEDGVPRFDPLHTDQYAMFLWYLGNTAWRQAGDERLAARVYSLNKALHGLDLFYELPLRDVWCLQHPVGSVLGRASYGEYFCFYQGCTVGVGMDGGSPSFGRGVVMFGDTSVIGNCTIGDNVWLATGAAVYDQDVPSNSLVVGRSPDLTIRPTRKDVINDFFTLLPPVAASTGTPQ